MSLPVTTNLSLIPEVSAELNRNTLFVVNHSGGKDSQAMMIEVLKIVPRNRIVVVHASLGIMEWFGALEHAKAQADAAGVPFIVAKSKKTFLDMVLHRFETKPDVPSWPSAKYRQCTSDLKRDQITKEVRHYANAHGFTRIVNCMGMRAQESPRRAKLRVWKNHAQHGVAGREWFDWLPIHAFTVDHVFSIISQAGQQPHYAYAAGNDRLSCVYCIMASAKDLINGAINYPSLYAIYCFIEVITGYAMHSSMKFLPELTGINPDYSYLSEYPELLLRIKEILHSRKRIPVVLMELEQGLAA